MSVLNDHGLQTYSGGMSGPIVELPGGDLALAFGAEIRHEFRTSDIDHTANQEGYAFLIGNTDAKAARDVYGGYLEARFPFFDGFELQTAGRIERYTDIERNAISPSAGLTLIPSEMIGRDQTPSAFRKLQFRLHGTRAFRAPTIFQSFPGQATVPSGIILEGDTSPTFIPVTYAGNPDLIEEKAWALSAGLAWQPVDEIGLTSDVWWYDYRDKIFQSTPSQILSEDARLMEDGGSDPRVQRADDGTIERIFSRQINVPEPITTYGLDFGAMFTLTGKTFGGSENDWGKVGFGAQGTWTWSYSVPIDRASSRLLPNGERLPPADCDDDSCEVAGKRNDTNFAPPIPVLKMNIPVTYENNGHNIAIIPRFVSGVQDDAALPQSGELGEVPPWVTLDAMYSYTLKEFIGNELTLRVGVINLIDTPPPATRPGTKLNATAYEPLLYDPRGRVFYASAISQF
jgi:iron complex outermembrane receptor protein